MNPSRPCVHRNNPNSTPNQNRSGARQEEGRRIICRDARGRQQGKEADRQAGRQAVQPRAAAMGKKDKEKKGDGEGLPSTEFMIKPETATPKLDTSKYVSLLRVCMPVVVVVG